MSREVKLGPYGIDINTGMPLLGVELDLSARLVYVSSVEEFVRNTQDVPSVFNRDELAYCLRYKVRTDEHFAARIGAKEIALGFLDRPELGWEDVWVRNNQYNSPSLELSDNAQRFASEAGIRRFHISLAHEDNMALSFFAADIQNPQIIVRVGTDLCSTMPFQAPTIRRTSTFNEEEMETARRQEFPARRMAMYFAAKESVIKILESLSGWIWKEIEIHEAAEGEFSISLSGSAKERLDQVGASRIVTSLQYQEGIGAMAFSVALATASA